MKYFRKKSKSNNRPSITNNHSTPANNNLLNYEVEISIPCITSTESS